MTTFSRVIYFATQNKHKLQEAQAVLEEYGIAVQPLDIEKDEEDSPDIETVARREAGRIAHLTKKPVIVDDTGVFFEAIPNFPGPKAKRVFEQIGYAGLFKKLEHKSRAAKFVCCVAYCRPEQEPVSFLGELEGEITTEVYDQEKDVLPYERIFRLSDGRIVSSLSREEKNRISHRAAAFRKLGVYLSQKFKLSSPL